MRVFHKIHQKLNWSNRHYFLVFCLIIFISYVGSAIYQSYKRLPEGLNYTGKLRHAQVEFIANDANQATMLKLINEAQRSIVLDLATLNQEVAQPAQPILDALIRKKRIDPLLEVTVITDPSNSAYGGVDVELYRQLRLVGIDVIETNLLPLRASNPLWSGFWYLCCQGLGNNTQKGWLENPLGHGQVTLRSYLNWLNLKANHRQALVVDTPTGWQTLIGGINLKAKQNQAALLVTGNTAVDLLNTQRTVAQFSQGNLSTLIVGEFEAQQNLPQVQVLTEQAIYHAILNLVETAKPKDHLDVTAFYLSERHVIEALKQAQQRGVTVRILLEKNQLPNQPVANELTQSGIQLRWCAQQQAQCSTNMILKYNQAQAELILGSAHFTARSLKNYNLETDVRVIGQAQAPVFQDAKTYFAQLWLAPHSVDYAKYAQQSIWQTGLYRWKEWSGWSDF